MRNTELTLADLPAGTRVYVITRKVSGTVIEQLPGDGNSGSGSFLNGRDAVRIDFGDDRIGYNFPEQCAIVEG